MADFKYLIILLLFWTSVQCFVWPQVTITPSRPSGLKACVPDLPNIEKFSLCATILPVKPGENCDYKGSAFRAKNNQWCIVRSKNNRNNTWDDPKDTIGMEGVVDTLQYTVNLTINGEVHGSSRLTKIIKEGDFKGNTRTVDRNGCLIFSTVKNTRFDINILRTELSDNNVACEKKLSLAKEALETMSVQFSEMTTHLANLETAFDKSQAELADSQRFAKEAINMIEGFQGPNTNKLILNGTLVLEPHLPILKELITYDIGIDPSSYKIVNSQPITQKQVVFELNTYAEKIKIFLHSKVKLKHSKLHILDYDKTVNLNFN